MKIMSLDAEYNQPSRKCIQIGAVIYNPHTGRQMAQFSTYVDPGEPIAPHITELTGITDQDVRGAPSIKEAYFMLKEFHDKNQVFMNPLVWGSGTRNDSQAIHEEAGVDEPNFMGYRVIDVKGLYQSIQIYKNKMVRGGLYAVCTERLKIGFEGKEHTALADAINTFRVWFYLIKKFGE